MSSSQESGPTVVRGDPDIVEGGAHGGWKYYLGLSLRDSEEVFIG